MSDQQTDAPQNHPGQPALAYRVTTQDKSLARMLARLPESSIPSGPNQGSRPLAALTTRAATDPAVALLDGWAGALDVLTFYQERILNEGFLRTATESLSVRELARALGYRPTPATAAATHLAFLLDTSPGMPTSVTVPAGTRALSVPAAASELPQTFETTAALGARLAWNTLKPRLAIPQELTTSNDASTGYAVSSLRLATLSCGLRETDLLLINDTTTVRVTSVVPNVTGKYTTVGFEVVDGPAVRVRLASAPADGDPRAAPRRLDTGALVTAILGASWDDEDLAALISDRGLSESELVAQADATLKAATVTQGALAFRQRTSCFGAEAQPYATLAKISSSYTRGSASDDVYDTSLTAYKNANWDDSKYQNKRTVWLDSWGNRYCDGASGCDLFLGRSISLLPGGRILLTSPSGVRAYTLSSTVETTVRGYGTQTRTTGLVLTSRPSATAAASDVFLTRETGVHVQSEALPLSATVPLAGLDDTPVQSGLVLAGLVLGLASGQVVALSGELAAQKGVVRTEVVTLTGVRHCGGYTQIAFGALSAGYVRESITLCANVAPASHGETVADEVLGSGDAGLMNQRFTLRRSPVTFLPAATASGCRSTLTVRVNGVEWREVESLLDEGPDSPCYALETDASGQTQVVFGDGVYGARLPSGQHNVTASYRVGSGASGEVAAGAIKLLIKSPYGLRSVTNPVAASGASEASASTALRELLPRSVATLGRAVSLADYEELSRSYPGIAKAQATAVFAAAVPAVHLTVATDDGTPLDRGSTLYRSLLETLLRLGNPTQPLLLDDYRPKRFRLHARLVIDPRYVASTVQAQVTAALTSRFGFARRSFGQPVRSAEVLYTLQSVPGVLGVLLDALFVLPPPDAPPPVGPDGRPPKSALLVAEPARLDRKGRSSGAELLLLELSDDDLEIAP